MNTQETLTRIIQNNPEDLWLLSKDVLKFIYSQDREAQLSVFSLFLKDLDITDFDFPDMNDHFNLSDINYQYFRDISRTEKRILQNLINANVSEDEFYEKLWNKLNDSDLFPNFEDKTALLLSLWLDTRIPYYQLGDSCSMENDEFKSTIDLLSPQIKKARFIVYSGKEQKTQRTSLLMDVADTITEYKEKVVFWSYIISMIAKIESRQTIEQTLEDTATESDKE